MTNATLYGNAKAPRTQKVLVAAKVANKKVDVKDAAPPKDKFPIGVAPAYEEGNVHLFTAGAIAKHVASSNVQYVPEDPAVDQWLLWSEGELSANVLSYVLPSVSVAHVDHAAVEAAKAELNAQLQHLDKYLSTRTFLVGERLSVADVSVALDVLPAFQHVLDEKARKQFPHVTRWYLTVINQKVVKEVVGEVPLAEKVSTFNIDTFKKNQPKKDDKKHDNKKHDNKAEKKEKAPPKEKPAKPAEEPEDDTPQEPKFTDPFLEFPGGDKFNVDAFKRVYSNEDTLTKAIPHFWEHFDPAHYSIWYCEYKYPEELSLVFMSCNLITGMFQRLDKMRKHAFGSVCLFGKDNDSTISGIWFWRGPKLAFELCQDWQIDYESYDWKKLDPADPATKKTVNAYWAWEGFDNPKEFNQGKIFK